MEKLVFAEKIPQLSFGGSVGLSFSGFIKWLENLTGQDVYKSADYAHQIYRAMMRRESSYWTTNYGIAKRVEILEVHQGGKYMDVTGLNNGYRNIPVTEDWEITFIFFFQFDAGWRIARVIVEADRPCNHFGGRERNRALARAIQIACPSLAEDIKVPA